MVRLTLHVIDIRAQNCNHNVWVVFGDLRVIGGAIAFLEVRFAFPESGHVFWPRDYVFDLLFGRRLWLGPFDRFLGWRRWGFRSCDCVRGSGTSGTQRSNIFIVCSALQTSGG